VAADQFRHAGYHNVGINEIADALGLTGPALYRHFRTKQELLGAAVEEAIDHVANAYAQPYDELPDLLDAAAAAFLERRYAGVLWQREAVHLPRPLRFELQTRGNRALDPLRALISGARPDLSSADVELLVSVCQMIFASVGYHPVKLDAEHVRPRLVEAAMAVCHARALPVRGTSPHRSAPMPHGRLLPTSRRETVRVVATRLFAERGYQAVSMDDIGAAAGVAGPSLYRHFPSKSAILIAELTRFLEALMFDVSAALELAESAEQALELLVESLVRITIQHGVAMGALLNEMVNVPAEERRALHRMQADYVAEWVSLLVTCRRDLDAAEAHILVNATQTVFGLLSRARRFRQRPEIRGELMVLGRAMLGLDVLEA
jgi:AcrR family transcriptional regulator